MKKMKLISLTATAIFAASVALPVMAEEATSSSAASSTPSSSSSSTSGAKPGQMLNDRAAKMRAEQMLKAQQLQQKMDMHKSNVDARVQKVETRKQAKAACAAQVATLVSTREDAIIAAHTAFFASWTSARQTLKTALVAAWNSGDNAARTAAWKANNETVKKAATTRRTAVKAAQTKFVTDARAACKGTGDNATAAAAASTEASTTAVME